MAGTGISLSFQWGSLEDARRELEAHAGYYLTAGGSSAAPQVRIQLKVEGTPPLPPPPPHATVLKDPKSPRKVLGYMWVIVMIPSSRPQPRWRFQDSWVRLVEFVLGRLWHEQNEALRHDLVVSCIFHEIRNPLTAILNSVDLLLEGVAATRHNLQLIEANVTYLLQVTTDLLELFRISQNRIACKLVPCRPRELLNQVAAIFSDIQVTIYVPDYVPVEVLCDATKYKQILINLLSNSRKFQAKSIVIRVAYRDGRLYTEVADDGPGIPPETSRDVFKALGKSTTGLGIGLFMCRKLVQLMQGEILLKQNSEQGCTFALQFPVSPTIIIPTAASAEQTTINLKPDGIRVLIVDDHAAIRDTLQQMMQTLPTVQYTATAVDGQDAVEKIQTAHEPFDWVFLDLKMPRKSGWQVAQELAENNNKNNNTTATPKIIFISAFSLSGAEKAASQSLGVMGFIQKPFRKADVLSIMKWAASSSQGPRLG